MTIKLLVGVGSIIVTIAGGCISWSISYAERVTASETTLKIHADTLLELKSDLKLTAKQNRTIQTQLTELLHKQDKRLDILEHMIADPKQ